MFLISVFFDDSGVSMLENDENSLLEIAAVSGSWNWSGESSLIIRMKLINKYMKGNKSKDASGS